jgi:CBS domain-containing protein
MTRSPDLAIDKRKEADFERLPNAGKVRARVDHQWKWRDNCGKDRNTRLSRPFTRRSSMLVRHVLEARGRELISVRPEAAVKDALALFVIHGIGSVPVVDASGKLIGIFTERDVLYGDFDDSEQFHRRVIGEVMTRDPITCSPDDPVSEVMDEMSHHRVGQVPVVDNGVLIGLVSVGDLIKSLHDQVETENQHLTAYIQGPI